MSKYKSSYLDDFGALFDSTMNQFCTFYHIEISDEFAVDWASLHFPLLKVPIYAEDKGLLPRAQTMIQMRASTSKTANQDLFNQNSAYKELVLWL